jgi:uncharacterized peroxidase-related enzyme
VAFIRLTEPDDASGALAGEYDEAIKRAGKVFNIVKAMSPNPRVLRHSMALYGGIMHGPSELSRVERELLAVVVSRENDCHYWIVAHANDLRAEGAADELVRAAQVDYREAELEPRVRSLCDFAVKLTRGPASMRQDDVDALRLQGLSDAAIHDAVQVISYFNYVNRVADAIGIEDESEWAGSGPQHD